ncbi:hypothetical protein IFM89_030883 [Coptis chinensis]|uniref:Uncharacterized protein n=1 Tax=Coptis chinensis TaxID=261450 RepID=A0A835HYH4_9MAGN|nr:hypothetical protein IFM89_030883 [Coptis chinensis]
MGSEGLQAAKAKQQQIRPGFGKGLLTCWSNTGPFVLELLFSYNIAVDRSDEVKRTLNKSAASVGLQLPEVYQP